MFSFIGNLESMSRKNLLNKMRYIIVKWPLNIFLLSNKKNEILREDTQKDKRLLYCLTTKVRVLPPPPWS